ncbi:MAG: metal-sensing transcriptional repressor [Acutalibacter sp.]|jgi:DNA-binding FrmR family transcriptional regulator
MAEEKKSPEQTTCSGGCCVHHKATPRDAKELRQLQNRLKRMIGQLGGISKMLDDNRYCGDILIQVAAVESALQSFGYLVLQDHLETCVVEEIRKGNTQIVDEAVELIKKLK